MEGANKEKFSNATSPSGQQKTRTSKAQEDAAKQIRRIANEIFTQTAPLRQFSTSNLTNFLRDGTLPLALESGFERQLTTGREGLESQFGVARENILSRVPSRGGQLNEQLADLETSRAGRIGLLEADIEGQRNALRPGLFSSAISTGFGVPPQTIAGLNAAAGQFGNVAARAQQEQLQREQQKKEKVSGLGSAVGFGA
jgi:hypothetical protein